MANKPELWTCRPLKIEWQNSSDPNYWTSKCGDFHLYRKKYPSRYELSCHDFRFDKNYIRNFDPKVPLNDAFNELHKVIEEYRFAHLQKLGLSILPLPNPPVFAAEDDGMPNRLRVTGYKEALADIDRNARMQLGMVP